METIRTTVTAAILFGTLAHGRAVAADSTTTTTPAPTRRLVVSIPDRKLAVIENDAVVTMFPIAVGAAATPSPVGTFTIVTRVSNPTYYTKGKVIAPGARNPVGTRWIGLSRKGYGIHGTDNPRSIGYAKSHGCISFAIRTSSGSSSACGPATWWSCTPSGAPRSRASSASQLPRHPVRTRDDRRWLLSSRPWDRTAPRASSLWRPASS